MYKIEDFLIVPVPADINDRACMSLQNQMLELIKKGLATGLVIDAAAITVVDSFMAKIISNLASTASLLGAESVIVGIQPSIAIALVEMGLLKDMRTALNVEKGIEVLRKLKKAR